MSPTSRNTLMIGGALILIALMLVCGPLSDRLGLGGKGVEEAPSVAAGPPVEEVESADAVEAVAAGALVGASNKEPDVASLDEVKAEDEPAVVAEVAGAAAGAGVAAEGDSGAGGGGTVLPAVSAGVPMTDVVDEAAIAASAFDDTMASSDGLGSAGPVVDRFAPPVAAADGSPLALAAAAQLFGIDSGNLLQTCDSPGSGCQNLNDRPSRSFPPAESGPPRGR